FYFVLICDKFFNVENSLSAPFSQSFSPLVENKKSQTSVTLNGILFLIPNCQPVSFVCPIVLFSIRQNYSGINAVASISTKKSGFAKPATMRTEITGGFVWLPKNF